MDRIEGINKERYNNRWRLQISTFSSGENIQTEGNNGNIEVKHTESKLDFRNMQKTLYQL